MGKTKAVKRKQTLQLKETRKPVGYKFGSPLENLDFSKPPTAKITEGATTASEDDKGAHEMESKKLANFLEDMSSLADGSDQGSPSTGLANGTAPAAAEPSQPVATSKEEPATEAATASQDKVSQDKVTFWQRVWDDNTNRHYYWNPSSNEVLWELPPGGVEMSQGVGEEEESKDAMEEVEELMENYPYVKQEIKPAAKTEEESPVPASGEKAAESKGSPVTAQAQEEEEPKPGKKRKAAATAASPEEELVRSVSATASSSSSGSAESLAKKPRLGKAPAESGEDTPSPSPSRKKTATGGGSKQSEQMMRFQVSSIADQFSRKLEYLHVSTQKLSSFETLAIQLQTRLEDWKDGSLPTKSMLTKLKTMNEELTKCESTAAPEGWKYVWDSSTCRYQFLNTSTGLLTWEPPVQGPFSSDEADPQDSEAEPEAAAPEEKEEDTAVAAAPGASEPEEEKMETVVQGPSLPHHILSTPEATPAKEEEPSVLADNLYCISEPTPDQDPIVEKEPEESGKGSSTRKPYLGPTADYLRSSKEEGPVPVVSMPPPRHVAKKLLAIQKQKEEKERLAQIERESRPMTSRDVRQKFLSKLPLWKQKQLAKERASEEKQAQLESAASEEASQMQELTQYPPPDEDVEEISQYPPPGEPIEQYPPPAAADKKQVAQHPSPGGVEKREPATSQRSHPVQASEELVKYPILSQRRGEGYKPITVSVSSAQPAPSPVPPTHHMQTGELQYSQDSRPQKELYAPGGSQSPPQSAAQKEVKLREKLVHRVQSFKIGKSQESEASKTTSGEEIMEVDGASMATRQAEAPPLLSSAAAADELVVESTGEKQQQQQEPSATQLDPQQQQQPPVIGHSPQVASTSFQGSEAREPETGMMEGEPGEILDDSNIETEEVGGEEGRGDLEEGEMGEETEEEEARSKFPVGGKCYMDMEKGKDDVTDKSDLSADDSADSPAPKKSKEQKYSYSHSPDPGYRRKHSKKKNRRQRETDSEDDERYSESGYMRKGSEYKKRYSHQRGRSSKHHHHSRSKDYYQGPKEYYQGGPREYYQGESESDEYYYSSSSKKRRGGGGRMRERSYSPDEYKPSRKSGKSSRRYGNSRQRSRSRSHSYDSDHMMEREKRKSASSGKHKKKEKKKKRRRSSSRNRDGSGGEDKPAKAPPPNVLVGKVGKISTVRALGQEKKPDDSETKAAAPDANAALGAAPNMAMADPMAMRNLDPQQMSATYYQQPSTGQIPYYGTYPAYQYPYTQEAYIQPPPPPPEQPQQAKWQWGDADPAQWAAKNAANLAAEESQDSTAPAAGGETEEGSQESASATLTTGDASEGQGVESAPEVASGTATTEVQEQTLYPSDLPAAKEEAVSQDITASVDDGVAPPTTIQDESVAPPTGQDVVTSHDVAASQDIVVSQDNSGQDKVVAISPAQDVAGSDVAPPPPVSKTIAPPTGRVLRSSRRSRWSDRAVTESVSVSQATSAATTTTTPAGPQQTMTTDTVTTMSHPAPIPTAPSPADTTLPPPPLPSEPEVSKPPVPAPPPAEEEVTFVPPEPVAMVSAPALPPPPVVPPPPVAMETSSPVPPAVPPAPVAPQVVTTPPLVQPSPPVVPEPAPMAQVTPPLPPPEAEGDTNKPSSQDEESAVEMEMEIESDHNSPAPGPPPADAIKGEDQEAVLPEKEKQEKGAEAKQEGGVATTDSTEELYSFAQPISEALGKMESAEGTQQEATPSQQPASTVASATPPVSAAATYYPPTYAASAAATTYSQQQQAYSYAYAQNYNYAQAAYMQQAAAYGAYGMQPAQYYYGGAAYGSYPTATPGYYGAYGTTGYTAVSAPSQIPVSPAAASTATTDPAGKKSDFTLAGNKEKPAMSMMDKWNAFKDDKM